MAEEDCELCTFPDVRDKSIDLSLNTDFHSGKIGPLPLRGFLRNKIYQFNFFETFPECSLPSTVSKNTIKMIGHPSRLRDVMGQS